MSKFYFNVCAVFLLVSSVASVLAQSAVERGTKVSCAPAVRPPYDFS